MDGEMRLGQHDAAGEAAALELVKRHADGGEAGGLDHLEALGAEAFAVQ
jgi:hypothetical protein